MSIADSNAADDDTFLRPLRRSRTTYHAALDPRPPSPLPDSTDTPPSPSPAFTPLNSVPTSGAWHPTSNPPLPPTPPPLSAGSPLPSELPALPESPAPWTTQQSTDRGTSVQQQSPELKTPFQEQGHALDRPLLQQPSDPNILLLQQRLDYPSTILMQQQPQDFPPMATPGKRGLCWPREHADAAYHLFTRPGSKVSWIYNWSPTSHLPGCERTLHWVPMQWSGATAESFPAYIQPPTTSAPCSHVLFLNEPERSDQANVSAADAAALWLQYVEPLRRQYGVRAGSPGIASTEEGIAWLQEFTRRIRHGGASDVDFWCLHWYGPADLGALYDYIWSAHARIGNDRPVWLTEYACTNWDAANPLPADRVRWFLAESQKYLDTLPWIERYAWFGPMRDPGGVGRNAALLDKDGGLSELGKVYRDG